MLKGTITTAVAFAIATLSVPASAEADQARQGRMPCGPRAVMVEKLTNKFGETRQGAGLINAKAAMEVWSSAKTGSWTILLSRADGVSCVIAAGKNWHRDRQTVLGSAI